MWFLIFRFCHFQFFSTSLLEVFCRRPDATRPTRPAPRTHPEPQPHHFFLSRRYSRIRDALPPRFGGRLSTTVLRTTGKCAPVEFAMPFHHGFAVDFRPRLLHATGNTGNRELKDFFKKTILIVCFLWHVVSYFSILSFSI